MAKSRNGDGLSENQVKNYTSDQKNFPSLDRLIEIFGKQI